MVKHAFACSFVLLVLVCTLNVAVGAAIGHREHSISKRHDYPVARQASEVESSSEDSDEDDEESDDDAALAHSANAYAAQYAQGDSQEDSEEEGDDDDGSRRRRRRRDTAPAVSVTNEKTKKPISTLEEAIDQAVDQAVGLAVGQVVEEVEEEEKTDETTLAPTVAGSVTTTSTRKPTSVLVQIRDALKKVTTGLPTEQVANNALQYFQLFEHFIQQTIEQYIDDDDDDEDEAPLASPLDVSAKPEDGENDPSTDNKKTPETSSSPDAVAENVINAIGTKPEPVAEAPAKETATSEASLSIASSSTEAAAASSTPTPSTIANAV